MYSKNDTLEANQLDGNVAVNMVKFGGTVNVMTTIPRNSTIQSSIVIAPTVNDMAVDTLQQEDVIKQDIIDNTQQKQYIQEKEDVIQEDAIKQKQEFIQQEIQEKDVIDKTQEIQEKDVIDNTQEIQEKDVIDNTQEIQENDDVKQDKEFIQEVTEEKDDVMKEKQDTTPIYRSFDSIQQPITIDINTENQQPGVEMSTEGQQDIKMDEENDDVTPSVAMVIPSNEIEEAAYLHVVEGMKVTRFSRKKLALGIILGLFVLCIIIVPSVLSLRTTVINNDNNTTIVITSSPFSYSPSLSPTRKPTLFSCDTTEVGDDIEITGLNNEAFEKTYIYGDYLYIKKSAHWDILYFNNHTLFKVFTSTASYIRIDGGFLWAFTTLDIIRRYDIINFILIDQVDMSSISSINNYYNSIDNTLVIDNNTLSFMMTNYLFDIRKIEIQWNTSSINSTWFYNQALTRITNVKMYNNSIYVLGTKTTSVYFYGNDQNYDCNAFAMMKLDYKTGIIQFDKQYTIDEQYGGVCPYFYENTIENFVINNDIIYALGFTAKPIMKGLYAFKMNIDDGMLYTDFGVNGTTRITVLNHPIYSGSLLYIFVNRYIHVISNYEVSGDYYMIMTRLTINGQKDNTFMDNYPDASNYPGHYRVKDVLFSTIDKNATLINAYTYNFPQSKTLYQSFCLT